MIFQYIADNGGAIASNVTVGMFLVAILRGWLVVRRQLMDLREDHALQLVAVHKDLAEWRAAYHVKDQQNITLMGQLDDLIDVNKTILAVLGNIPGTKSNGQSPGTNGYLGDRRRRT